MNLVETTGEGGEEGEMIGGLAGGEPRVEATSTTT